jgi:iron-sulfur cluster repair protein YtfE (RIC family)
MKRHEAIAPLSRDHHHSLILAQMMKKDAPSYKGLPGNVAEKALYAQEQFEKHIVQHFQQEETILENVKHMHPSINALAAEIKSDHFELTALFNSLATTNDPEMIMNKLALKLEYHIRLEERILFPLLQEQCSETELAVIYKLLH